MDERSFFDLLYQGWSKTTGAENMVWAQEEDPDEHIPWQIFAVDQEQSKRWLGSFFKEEDAAFFTALHGCFADLTRRLHSAVDEADRLDELKDQREFEMAEVAIENADLLGKIGHLETVIDKMDQELIQAKADAVYWSNEANSYDWRNEQGYL